MSKKWGKADAKALKKLLKNMEQLADHDWDAFCQELSRELAARLLAKVIKRTPVGKRPELKGDETVQVTGASGETRSFLTAEAARLQQYWGGYMGGTLRRGWTAKTADEAENSKRGGSVKAYVDSIPIVKKGNLYEIEIVNSVLYASYVEYGHRQSPGRYVPALGKRLKNGWVKGRFMLTISEQELRQELPSIVEKRLLEYLERSIHGK